MPVQAMSFLYVRGLARGDHHHDELARAVPGGRRLVRRRADRNGVDARSVRRAARRTTRWPIPTPPRPPSPACCASRRASASCSTQKMSLGSEPVKDLGNLYSAALPAWIAAGFEEAGAAEARPGGRADGRGRLRQRRRRRGAAAVRRSLASKPPPPASASCARWKAASPSPAQQYEALHDGTEIPALTYTPKDEFAIARVGKQYGAGVPRPGRRVLRLRPVTLEAAERAARLADELRQALAQASARRAVRGLQRARQPARGRARTPPGATSTTVHKQHSTERHHLSAG